jgi:hypothetical protein
MKQSLTLPRRRQSASLFVMSAKEDKQLDTVAAYCTRFETVMRTCLSAVELTCRAKILRARPSAKLCLRRRIRMRYK